MEDLTTMIENMIKEPIENMGYKLFDVDYVKEGKEFFLRVYVDKEEGIDVEECADISEVVSVILDEHNPIEHEYYLEVSSPGIERPLKNKNDLVGAIGSFINVRLYEKIDDTKEFEGTLLGFDEENDQIELEITIKTRKKVMQIPYKKIAKARLAVKF